MSFVREQSQNINCLMNTALTDHPVSPPDLLFSLWHKDHNCAECFSHENVPC